MFDSPQNRRKSIRLKNYDYSTPGYYFVTICTRERECILGEVKRAQVILNRTGQIVLSAWQGLPARFPFIELDAFVVMPNHVHGVIVLKPRRGEPCVRPKRGDHKDRPYPTPRGTPAFSLARIIQAFKSLSTRQWLQDSPPEISHANTKLWQQNYYEHVIRRDESLEKIRQYILENPLKWDLDEDNPRNINPPRK